MSQGVRESRSVTYASARAAVEGAHRQAEILGVAVAAAVVDGAGNIVAVGRMDKAPFGVTALAIDKAFTAAAFAARFGVLPGHRGSPEAARVSPGRQSR